MTNLTKMSNKQLVKSAFKQIEKETGFHIKEYKFEDTYFIISDEKDSICHFRIKEIPGFLFAFWNTCRFKSKDTKQSLINWFDYLGVNSKSELIFFVQYERDIDKFKPSASTFIDGIFRQSWQESDNNDKIINKEEWSMYRTIDIIKFIHKHKIKAAFDSYHDYKYSWQDVSNLKILKWFIITWIKESKDRFIYKHKYNWTVRRCKRFCKKLTQFSTLICDYGDNWSPRIHVSWRRHNKLDYKRYEQEVNKLLDFRDKNLNNIGFNEYETYINFEEPLDKEEITQDKKLYKNFQKAVKYWTGKLEEKEILIYSNISSDYLDKYPLKDD